MRIRLDSGEFRVTRAACIAGEKGAHPRPHGFCDTSGILPIFPSRLPL